MIDTNVIYNEDCLIFINFNKFGNIAKEKNRRKWKKMN